MENMPRLNRRCRLSALRVLSVSAIATSGVCFSRPQVRRGISATQPLFSRQPLSLVPADYHIRTATVLADVTNPARTVVTGRTAPGSVAAAAASTKARATTARLVYEAAEAVATATWDSSRQSEGALLRNLELEKELQKLDLSYESLEELYGCLPAIRACKAFILPRSEKAYQLANSDGRAAVIATEVRKLIDAAKVENSAWQEHCETLRNVHRSTNQDKLQQLPLTLVLDSLRSTQNVGSLLRSSFLAGVSEVVLCGITPGPPDSGVLKVAGSAAALVPISRAPNATAAVQRLQKEGFEVWAMETTCKAQLLGDMTVPSERPLAIVLGMECVGVSSGVLATCDHHVVIPMRGFKNSLNVAVAGSITIFDIARQLRSANVKTTATTRRT
eukprot:TRINITY_DN109639_c0_g1_i1.p1 TRINITY_DN109639_c0_g1~~TRINITY_DN109639_c0_g1_i1.p1  ORF type:complete len:389 (+),score=67.01 TRINITY_DN109639_c0_g1_i1:87-1253(+)